MAKMYYENDGNLNVFNNKKIAVIGYGSQGHAHALNLKDSGVDVVVGLYKGSKSWERVKENGLEVMEVADAVKCSDVVMLLVPDEHQKKVYETQVKENLKPGSALAFAHGFNIHFSQIVPPADIDVFMVAPKGPGHLVRRVYQQGHGVPGLLAVYQDKTGKAKEVGLAYAKGIGATRAGVIETTFQEETETDLFPCPRVP